jgi:hypothetical protein
MTVNVNADVVLEAELAISAKQTTGAIRMWNANVSEENSKKKKFN